MAGSKEKIIETLQGVDTVLVTVGKSPSVDELSAALGLTIFLNESGKHATAVMSGDIPPAISFLEPEKTFENTIDSLRDFVIALDKDKADHLRYKLVDDVVKIFITPYRSIITEKDLKYSKGDYNVELVIAIGVKNREDLDKSLASHGRILHDATVATIGLGESKLGDPDWFSKDASSLSELVSSLISKLREGDKKIDKRVASALLTGIVSATDRFSNDRTTPESLTVAAELMSYGANQQLIALKLREGSKLDIMPEDGSKKLTGDIDKEGDESNKKPSKSQRNKDKTKFSIDHTDNEDESNDRDSNNKRSGKRQDNRSKRDKVQKQNPKVEKPEETAAPVETTAPARIGISEDGEYDPAAALDEALKISEKKRVESYQMDTDKLAEELSQSMSGPSAPEPAPQANNQNDAEVPDSQLASNDINQTVNESIQNTQQQDNFNSEPVEAPVDNNQQSTIEQQAPAPQPEVTQTPTTPVLPPVQPASDIADVRQNNLPTSEVRHDDGPSFGGVLNATTESAAEARKLAESESRNRTILNRDSVGSRPSENSQQDNTPVGDSGMPSFEMTPPQSMQTQGGGSYENQTIVPPTPTGTLEEIDRQHRQPVDDSAEVRDMFEPSTQPLPAPSVPIGQPTRVEAPNTPPPPPMPDFSQLPPLPTQMPDFSQVPAQPGHLPSDAPLPENLGQILPPAPPTPPQPQQSNDPGQFQIPSQ